MGIGQELLDITAKIELAKKEKAQAEGALQMILQRLMDEYGMDSYTEASDYIEQLEKECENNEVILKNNMKDIRENYDV